MSQKLGWRHVVVIAFVLICTLPVRLVLAAAGDIMPVDQIQAGMHGIAKTVVSGSNIEEFGVEVLGIMKNKGPSGDLILVRTYGDVIERTGGIAQGMSGSPVYIDGKLVGAIAYGWSLTDHKIGMITPIGDMLKLWELPDFKNRVGADGDSLDIEPVATPVMAAGFSERALTMLQDKLKPLKLIPYAVGDSPQIATEGVSLEPGSAVGVQLVRGDVSLGALGTVTYVEDNKVLAFGHPFLKKGNSGYLMTNAYIFTTVNGLENPFKIGTTGQLIGLINQDRGAGVGGEVGRFPGVIPLSIKARDNSIGRTREAYVQVVQDEQLAPTITTVTVFNVVDKAMDRTGPGTAKVSFEISAQGMPGEILKRENMFYSPADIGEAALAEFYEAMALLAGNQFNSVDIMDVKVKVGIDEERRTATIMEARPNVVSAKPGEKVNLTIKLKPFRGEPINRLVSFTVPDEQPIGPLVLGVRGGGMIPLKQLLLKRQGLDEEMLKEGSKKSRTFADIVKDFMSRDRNNDIVVEIIDKDFGEFTNKSSKNGKTAKSPNLKSQAGDDGNSTIAPKADGLLNKSGKTEREDKKKSVVTTDYIIDGSTQVTVSIVSAR